MNDGVKVRSKREASDAAPALVDDDGQAGRPGREPQMHRTVDRVTQILEEVVYHPGMTFAEVARALGAPKSSVYGFIQGLLAKGWLYEDDRRFYLGPAVYGLTIASGHIRAGMVTQEDLTALHEAARVAVFLGVQAGDHLIYIGEAGGDAISGIEARSSIRRTLLGTAGGRALLAAWPAEELRTFLSRRGPDEAEEVETFLGQYEQIRQTRIATNIRLAGTRFALGTTVRDKSGAAVASITLVGRTQDLQPRAKKLGDTLLPCRFLVETGDEAQGSDVTGGGQRRALRDAAHTCSTAGSGPMKLRPTALHQIPPRTVGVTSVDLSRLAVGIHLVRAALSRGAERLDGDGRHRRQQFH
jgi:DNA-binding IclR family transcriptional regulator